VPQIACKSGGKTTKFPYLTTLLAAASVAAWIGITPTASADSSADEQSCTSMGVASECQSPGNVQINESPPVQFGPQYPFWEGDLFSRFHAVRGRR
jgi:hypothetical protein